MTDTAKFDADSIMTEPSDSGRFGEFGGRFIPETLVPALSLIHISEPTRQ